MDDPSLGETLTRGLCALIAIPSPYPPGDSVAIAAHAAARLRRAGYRVEVASRKPGVDNVVAKLGAGSPRIVFNAHVDTVGIANRADWRGDPYRGEVRDGLVFGLGAGNCKGSMEVHLWLAEELARRGGPARGEVAFTFVADEENLGPEGMAFLREAGHVKPDILILGAQTENQLIVAERGVLWARIETRGRAAHAGNPSAGDNAILRMLRIIQAIEAELTQHLAARRDGAMASTINLGQIHGGLNTNVVPSACVAEIDRRLLPAERVKDAFAEIEAIAKRVEPGCAVTFLTGTNGFKAPADGAGTRALAGAIERRLGAPARFLNATGVSDGRYFADDAIEIINFGPGAGASGHAANESVPIAQMVDAALIQLAALEELVGFKRG